MKASWATLPLLWNTKRTVSPACTSTLLGEKAMSRISTFTVRVPTALLPSSFPELPHAVTMSASTASAANISFLGTGRDTSALLDRGVIALQASGGSTTRCSCCGMINCARSPPQSKSVVAPDGGGAQIWLDEPRDPRQGGW